jgi:hypothetical protein
MATTLNLKEFHVKVTDRAVGRNIPQRMGRALWLPMLVMALMAFPAGVILAGVRAQAIASNGSAKTIAALGQFVPAVNFIGFASVFASISFAIARIFGELRVGGGEVQEAAGRKVETLETPAAAKIFIGGMAMATMLLIGAVVLHVVAGTAIANGSAYALGKAGQWSIWLEAIRRFGVALYLASIAFGLATIITVLRFQAIRISELPNEATIR